MRFHNALKQGLVAGVCFAGGAVVTAAFANSTHIPPQILLSSSQSGLGQDLEYPSGTPVITAAIVTLMPGESTGDHRHDVPMFAMILDGEVTVDYGQDGTRVFVQDDALIEAFGTYHNGTNSGTEPVRILAVYAGSDTASNTVMRE